MFSVSKNAQSTDACVWLRGINTRACDAILFSHQCEVLVKDHLLHQRWLVVKEMRLHVTPHVRKPPELVYVLQQEIVTVVFLLSAWTRANTQMWLVSPAKSFLALQYTHTHSHLPVWKNFPEKPKLKVKFEIWVRSMFWVSRRAWERKK